MTAFQLKRYKERQRLLDLLRDCKLKLQLYHKATAHEYPGGPLLSDLLQRINAELEE